MSGRFLFKNMSGMAGAGSFFSFMYREKNRNIVLQILLLLGVLAVGWYLVGNLLTSLEKQNIASGLGFLEEKAGFGVSQSLIAFDNSSTYARAFWVGLLNTLLVAMVGIVLATLLGFLVGIARLSKNMLVSGMAGTFVEIVRNLPLLLQLFFWYFAVLRALPHPRQSLNFADSIFLNKRGLYLPEVQFGPYVLYGLGFAALILAGLWGHRYFAALLRPMVQDRLSFSLTGLPVIMLRWWFWVGVALLVLMVSAFWGLQVDYPALRGFNFRGGVNVNPEFMALLIGLSVYTAAYIAEIVRGGILAVPRGQIEGGKALGLTSGQRMRMIVLPQAFRIIIPPLTNQYLNLTKNSSLAVAIGYPDLTSVFAGIVLSQTGQAVEIILITMGVYLLISLLTSLFMNWFNARMALVER